MRYGGVQDPDFYLCKRLQHKIVILGNKLQLIIILATSLFVSLFVNDVNVIKNAWIIKELGIDIADLTSM